MRGTYYPLGAGEELSEGEYHSYYADPDPSMMGEEAYLAACDEFARRGDGPPPKALSEPRGTWRTRDGRVLRVSEMSSLHLANTIRLFERAGWGSHAKLVELRAELEQR